MRDIIREIRTDLRLAMNGVVSSSMREKGIHYKINFGVSIPELKKIAKKYTPNAELAEKLWMEDIREFKILATLLYPADSFSPALAEQWAMDIKYQEIAEQYCANLLENLPFAEYLADEWIFYDEEYVIVMGYILCARLCMKGHRLRSSHAESIVLQAKKELIAGVSRKQRAAILALKKYGRQSIEQATVVLTFLSDLKRSGRSELREFYNELKFEFEYYR